MSQDRSEKLIVDQLTVNFRRHRRQAVEILLKAALSSHQEFDKEDMLGLRIFRYGTKPLPSIFKGLKPKNLLVNNRYFHLSKAIADSSCVYRSGYVVLTVPLPSRNEDCEFTFLPISNTVKTVLENIQDEDKGVDRVAIYSMDGNRVSNSTPVDILIQNNFKLIVNDKSFDITTPKPEIFPINYEDQLSTTKNMISQLYTDINVQAYKETRERAIGQYLESLKQELEPLDDQKALIDMKSARRTNTLIWAGLGYMGLQFGFLARLTWWEYSWDIMEPVTYFVTYFSSMLFYAYFVLTREDFNYPEVKNRSHLLSFHKESDKLQFDVHDYNAKKDQVSKLEYELRLLKSPPVFFDMNKAVKE